MRSLSREEIQAVSGGAPISNFALVFTYGLSSLLAALASLFPALFGKINIPPIS